MYNKFLGSNKRGIISGLSQFLIKKQHQNYGYLAKINDCKIPSNSQLLQDYKNIQTFAKKQSIILKTQQFKFSQRNDGKDNQKSDNQIKNKKEQEDYDYGTAEKENKIRKGMTDKEQKTTKEQRKGYGDMNEQIFDIQKDKEPEK